MTQSFLERELKFDVPADFVVPDVSGLLPQGGRAETSTAQLRSDYFDTEDRALLKADVTLRRRTGTGDEGWQLKIPHPPFREEIRVGVGAHEAPPEELQRLLIGVSGGRELRPLATVRTERFITRLLDADGRTLAHIDDDTVHASSSGNVATASQWREVEIELGNDESKLLARLGKQLRRVGARPAASTSKLSRAVTPANVPAENAKTAKPTKPTAGSVVGAYVAAQQRMILLGDLALRRGDDTVIHKTRVATRRLRSTLRIYADQFDGGRATHLDTELRWYAGVLGEVRDREVLQKRLDTMISAVDDTLLFGPVRARVDSELRSEQLEHWQILMDELSGDRYLALLADIEDWVSNPPQSPKAARTPKSLTRPLARAEKNVARRLRQADASQNIHDLHRARKAAKRARYAAELAEPVIGAKASLHQAQRYQDLQDLLGEHQDSVVSAELLRRLGAKAGTLPDENGFAFGILHEREEQAARDARAQAHRVVRRYS